MKITLKKDNDRWQADGKDFLCYKASNVLNIAPKTNSFDLCMEDVNDCIGRPLPKDAVIIKILKVNFCRHNVWYRNGEGYASIFFSPAERVMSALNMADNESRFFVIWAENQTEEITKPNSPDAILTFNQLNNGDYFVYRSVYSNSFWSSVFKMIDKNLQRSGQCAQVNSEGKEIRFTWFDGTGSIYKLVAPPISNETPVNKPLRDSKGRFMKRLTSLQ